MKWPNDIKNLSFLFLLAACNGGGGGGGNGITTGGIAITPNFLDLVSPAATLGTNPNPVISVGIVAIGSTVKIFTDASCSNEVGSVVATSETVNVTVSNPLSVGEHTFYARSISGALTSDCSTANVDYILGHPSVSVTELNTTHRDNFTDCGANQSSISERIANCAVTNLGSTVTVSQSEGKIWQLVSKIGSSLVWKDLKTGFIWSSMLGTTNWCVAEGDANGDNGECIDTSFQPAYPDAHSFCEEIPAIDYSAKNELGQSVFELNSWTRIPAPSLGENWTTGNYSAGKGRMGEIASDESPSVFWRLPSKSDLDTARVNGFTAVVKGGDSNFKIWSSTISSLDGNRYIFHFGEPNSAPFVTEMQNQNQVHCVAPDPEENI